MKLLLSFMLVLVLSSGFAQGEVEPFHKVYVFGNIELVLSKGDTYSIDAPDRGDDLKIKIEAGKLKISHRVNERMWQNPARVVVTYVDELSSLDVSAGAHAEHQGVLNAGDLSLSADSGSETRLEISAKDVEVIVGEGGVLTLKGKVRTLEAKSTTGGILKASDLEAEIVYVRTNTGGNAIVNALERVEASASMGGVITIVGDPEDVRISESLGGTVNN